MGQWSPWSPWPASTMGVPQPSGLRGPQCLPLPPALFLSGSEAKSVSHANYNNPSWGYLPRPLLCLVLGPPEPTSPRPVCTWPAFLGLSAPHRGPLMCPHLGCTPGMRPQSPGGVALGPLGAEPMPLCRCPQVLVMHPHPTTSRLVSPSWSQSPGCGRAPRPQAGSASAPVLVHSPSPFCRISLVTLST